MTVRPRRHSKPAPPHNRLMAPGQCMCVECCRKVLALQCQARDHAGQRCGDYDGHDGDHTLLVATRFLTAAERIRLDGGGDHG